ncbi:MAG TPA: hypothetical protein VF132_06785 [Rudaea sp.]
MDLIENAKHDSAGSIGLQRGARSLARAQKRRAARDFRHGDGNVGAQ